MQDKFLNRFTFVAGLAMFFVGMLFFAAALKKDKDAYEWMKIAAHAQANPSQPVEDCEAIPAPVAAPALEPKPEFSILEVGDECFSSRPDGHATDGCHCPTCRKLDKSLDMGTNGCRCQTCRWLRGE